MNHKTILVTGASRGIGKAIALTYAKNGWDVVITCLRREEELKKTQREIEALGVSCLAWMGDAGDFESCSRLFDAIRERFGSLDVLVNNAGISYIGLFQDMTPDEWNHILNTNLTSVFNCCRLAVPMMVPTTATVLPRKNAPSQVAQYETPAPRSSSSPGTSNVL